MKQVIFGLYLLTVIAVVFFSLRVNKSKVQTLNRKINEGGAIYVPDHITPLFVFVMAFTAYSTIGIFDRVDASSVDVGDFSIFALSNIVGLTCFVLGYGKNNTFVHKKKLNMGQLIFKRPAFTGKISIGALILSLVFLVTVLLNFDTVSNMIVNFGSGNSYSDYSIREERTALSGLMQALGSYFQVLYLLVPFYRCYTRRKIGVFDIVVVVLYFSYAFFSGDRTTLILIVLMAAVLINEKISTFSLKFLMIAIIAGLFGMILLGHLRAYSSITEMLQMLQREGLGALVSVTSSGEFRNTTGTLLSYIKANDSLLDYRYLGVYLTEVILWIPAFLFPGRPMPLAEQYMLDFYPDAAAGTGHGWYILTDGYMAMGVLGIAIEMYIYGKLLNWIYVKFFKEKKDVLTVYMYVFFLLYVFYSVRSSMILTFKNYLITILPILLIYIVLKKYFINKGVLNE